MNDDDLGLELDAWLDDHGEQFGVPDPDGSPLVVEDERRASALLAKRVRLLDERDRISARAAERVDPILAWRDDRVRGIDAQVAFIDRSLEAFARVALPEARRKSLSLPSGSLKLTAPGSGSVEVTDLGEFVAWATDEQHPDRDALLRRTVDVEKASVKQWCIEGPDTLDAERGVRVFVLVDKRTGEPVPGVQLVKPADDRFSVTPRS